MLTVSHSTQPNPLAQWRRAATVLIEEITSAANAGEVALCTNPDDRRILQAELTALGRASLASALLGDAVWVITLLNGLETREMQRVAHVLQVIRLRLTRYYR